MTSTLNNVPNPAEPTHTPKAGQFASPYTGMRNNWPNGMDRDGGYLGFDDLPEAMLISAIIEFVIYVGMTYIETGS